jgi:Bacterial regulatory proteins, tetR family
LHGLLPFRFAGLTRPRSRSLPRQPPGSCGCRSSARFCQPYSLRGIAERLGVTPMALYRHVEGKDDLLDGMADLLYAELRAGFSKAEANELHDQLTAMVFALVSPELHGKRNRAAFERGLELLRAGLEARRPQQ